MVLFSCFSSLLLQASGFSDIKEIFKTAPAPFETLEQFLSKKGQSFITDGGIRMKTGLSFKKLNFVEYLYIVNFVSNQFSFNCKHYFIRDHEVVSRLRPDGVVHLAIFNSMPHTTRQRLRRLRHPSSVQLTEEKAFEVTEQVDLLMRFRNQ